MWFEVQKARRKRARAAVTGSTPAGEVPAGAGVGVEAPHAIRQHFALSSRTIELESGATFEVVSVAPMRFGGSDMGELSPAQTAKRAVLYVLPGGFVKPIQLRNWDFVAALVAAGMRVDIPLYGLLPEGDALAGIALIRAAYLDLVQDHGAQEVSIIGDSAGGSLALGVLIAASGDENVGDQAGAQGLAGGALPVPRNIILNAPWVDMDLANPEMPAFAARDPLLNAEQLRRQGVLWSRNLPQGTADPRVSPLHATPEQFRTACSGEQGSVQIDVWCGSADLSLPDARLLVARLQDAGIAASLHEVPGAIHMLHLTNTPEGRAARKAMIAALTQ